MQKNDLLIRLVQPMFRLLKQQKEVNENQSETSPHFNFNSYPRSQNIENNNNNSENNILSTNTRSEMQRKRNEAFIRETNRLLREKQRKNKKKYKK